ncbi:MAG TPA: hypothetical protein VEC35_01090 [Noviherbaspirillum sp.]|nr:hypothetical protein [Noviherbaspirillum sp.]
MSRTNFDLDDELKRRGNAAVAYALMLARKAFQEGRLDAYQRGYFYGQLLVAKCDLRAEKYIEQGALNEINFLKNLVRKGGAA